LSWELLNRSYRIIAGLTKGQRVVVEGIDRLTDGAQVTARDYSPAIQAVAE
jgi:multidrug efflux system membrane fusion protein